MTGDTRPRRPLRVTGCGLVVAGFAAACFMSGASAAPGSPGQASNGAPIREAQVFSEERTGVSSPVGLAYSSASSAFYVLGAQTGKPSEAEVVKLTPFDLSAADRAGSTRIAASLEDPINIAFDARRNRLLLLGQTGELVEVQVGSGGDPDPATLARHDIARFALADPQGVAVDPSSGTVFVLDAALPRIVRIDPDPSGGFDAATTFEIDLRSAGLDRTRGLAFDPSTRRLHLGSGRNLVELTTTGAVVATRDLSVFALTKTEGMVVAPSGDQTDADPQVSLYVADSGSAPTGSTTTTASAAPAPSAGQIMELSLTGPIQTASPDFSSSLVRTVNMGGLSPPSPDPSGITYVPSSDRLFISDGEVEEVVNGITHFQGFNVWELNRSGVVQRTTNISNVPPTQVPVTNEPVGTAFNPTNGYYYVSADDGKKVFTINPGADGLVGTTGDTVSSFDTLAVGNSDPEGITYDTFGGHLFVADGLNREIYEYTTGGGLVNHFDTAALGVEDPESVEFNPVSGTLFILSDALNTPNPRPIIVETTTSGTLIQTIDASASGAIKPAGLAYAPASNGSGVKRFYIVDRGIDNNNDPTAVDGKLYEMSAPAAAPPANLPPTVDAGTDQALTLPASANLDGTVSDDGLPMPPSLTTTWSQVSGPGTVTFGNASAVDTTASVTIGGIYVVRLTANDGQFGASDDVTLTFSGSASVQVLDIPVVMGNDDAEESTANVVTLGNADLDLMTKDVEANLVVGTRFRNVTLPPGATITNAFLQFTAEEADSAPTSLTIRGHAADNAALFTTVNGDLSNRPTTTASTAWTVALWPTIGETGVAQRSPNIAAIIQEIVNRPGWASGNALALLTRGSGTRVAESFNKTGTPGGDPLLHVEYSTGPGNSPPQITSDGGGSTAARSVPENQTAVTDVDASDPDSGDTVTYSISGGADQAKFSIVSTTGVLSFVTAPNFESPTDSGLNNVYDVTVAASDGVGGSDSQAIAVTVLNLNEFAPGITSDGGGTSAALSRPENSTAVTDVNATDGDGDVLTYAISGGIDAALFTIVPTTGVLTFVTAPNFEAPADDGGNNVYDVVIDASDGSLADTQAIAVTVTDVPENPPVINSNGGGDTAAVSVAENQTAVTDVDAADPDPGDTVTYSISGGADAAKFSVNASSGVLTFVSAPDFETPTDVGGNNVYDVDVRASDGSLFDTQAIAVTVTDLPENPPVINSNGGGDTAAVSVAENQTVVTDVDATDPDPGDTVTYSISGGADQTKFSIVPATGVLTFVSAPNFEAPTDAGANNVYDVIVRASDGILFDTQAIAVTVTDVPENPTITSNGGGDTAAVSAPENQTAVTDVDATDQDAGTTLTYSISGGTDSARFTIVPSTGVLTFVSAPDFETPLDVGGNNVYDVTVRASDGSLFDEQAIAVTVTDVVEGSGSQLYFTLFNGGTVGGVTAADEDIVFFNGTTFSLAFQGSDVGIAGFRIDSFAWVDATRLLLSFDQPGNVPGVAGTTDDSDIVLFTSTSLGATTAGTFSMYFDAGDVGLTTAGEDLDAVELLPNGRILLSTVNTATVTGVTADDEDLMEFIPSSLGPNTAGTFSMYFDGTDVGLNTTNGEDVDAAAVDATGKIYLSTLNGFSVTGVSGADEDVFVFTPTTLGSSTTGTFSSTLYFDGSVHGLGANDVFAVELP